MIPPTDGVGDGTATESTDTPILTDEDDALLGELDALGDPERASEKLFDPPEPAADLPSDAPETPPQESPAPVDAAPVDSPTDPIAAITKDAQPFTYTVDGQARPLDGAVVTKDGAVFFPATHADKLRSTLGLAEKSIADNKVLYQRQQEFERLGGLAKWEEAAAQAAAVDAAGAKLLAILDDPTQLLMLDEQGNVVKNQRAIDLLTRDLQLTGKEAAAAARMSFQTTTREANTQHQQVEQQDRALSYAVDQFRQQYPDLTPQDVETARQHFAAFRGALFRQATPDDAQRYGYRIGELLIDTPSMAPWFADRAALRKEQAESQKARSTAEAENRKRTTPPVVVSPRKTGKPTQPRNTDGTYAEKQADKERIRQQMRQAHRRGEFFVDNSTERDV